MLNETIRQRLIEYCLDVIRRQGVPEALCAIVLIDGVWVARPDRATRAMSEGQVLAVWPPIAGG